MTATHLTGKIRTFLHNESREAVLLHGFYISYIAILMIASVIDFFWQKYADSLSEVIFLLLCITMAVYYYRTKDTRLPSYGAIWIAAINLYVLLYNNGFDNHLIIFVVLLPLAPFFLLPLKEAVSQTLLFYLFLGLLMYYNYLLYDGHELLHNPSALINLGYAVFFIVSFGFFYHISIENAYRRIQHADTQKEILLKEVHHRVKNNLNMIASMLGLQARMYDTGIRAQLLNSKSRIEAISMVHEMLYQTSNFAEVDFKAYTEKLATLVASLYNRQQQIRVTVEADNITLPLETMLQLGLIINELLNNSFKYAFEPDQRGEIKILLKCRQNACVLIYHDNGKGYEETETLIYGRSLGVKLINLAVRQLRGSMEITNMKGLAYEIEFTHD